MRFLGNMKRKLLSFEKC